MWPGGSASSSRRLMRLSATSHTFVMSSVIAVVVEAQGHHA